MTEFFEIDDILECTEVALRDSLNEAFCNDYRSNLSKQLNEAAVHLERAAVILRETAKILPRYEIEPYELETHSAFRYE